MRTLSLVVIIIFILLTTISTFSQGTGRIHIVRRGDTLWDLSAFYLHNPFLWPSIYQANKVKIKEPHWIYPHQRFLIPPFVSKTQKVYIKPKKEERVKTVEAIDIAAPMVAVNLAFKGGYITRDKIEEGYIVESEPKMKENLVQCNTIYIDLGEIDGVKVGDMFTIFRWGRSIKNPATGKNLGKIVNILGRLVVTEVTENSSSCEITQSFDIINRYDKIMPYISVEIPLKSKLISPEVPIEGHLVAAKKEKQTIIPFDIVYIDLGELDGVSVGDYFEIVREGKVVSDPGPKRKVKLPEIIAGGVQILRTLNETSTCYISEINGNMDIRAGELIRLKGQAQEIKGRPVAEEEEKEEMEEEEEEEIIGPE
ncbi:MAG: hypothetical protein E3J87_08605 [Candidatus Cloacimonadota bacterium]|nr:MAG: hypothetical protein E3J87_08605 [Candidatus Cloacimonadota bacterium]